MSARLLPDFIAGDMRNWRAKKRRELRAVRSAVDTLRTGCAYTPLYPEQIRAMEQWLEKAENSMRGNWRPAQ